MSSHRRGWATLALGSCHILIRLQQRGVYVYLCKGCKNQTCPMVGVLKLGITNKWRSSSGPSGRICALGWMRIEKSHQPVSCITLPTGCICLCCLRPHHLSGIHEIVFLILRIVLIIHLVKKQHLLTDQERSLSWERPP